MLYRLVFQPNINSPAVDSEYCSYIRNSRCSFYTTPRVFWIILCHVKWLLPVEIRTQPIQYILQKRLHCRIPFRNLEQVQSLFYVNTFTALTCKLAKLRTCSFLSLSDTILDSCEAYLGIKWGINSVKHLGYIIRLVTLVCVKEPSQALPRENNPTHACENRYQSFVRFCTISFIHKILMFRRCIRRSNSGFTPLYLVRPFFLPNLINNEHHIPATIVRHNHLH